MAAGQQRHENGRCGGTVAGGRGVVPDRPWTGEDIAADGAGFLSVDAFVPSSLDAVATRLHLGRRHAERERDGLDLDPVELVTTGTRVGARDPPPPAVSAGSADGGGGAGTSVGTRGPVRSEPVDRRSGRADRRSRRGGGAGPRPARRGAARRPVSGRRRRTPILSRASGPRADRRGCARPHSASTGRAPGRP